MSNWLKCILKGGKCSVELKGRGEIPQKWWNIFWLGGCVCNFLPLGKRKWNASGPGDWVCFWGVYSLFIQTILLDYRLYCLYSVHVYKKTCSTQSVHVSVITLVHRLLFYHWDKSIFFFGQKHTLRSVHFEPCELGDTCQFQRSSIQGSIPVNLSISRNFVS